jgi:hypothetical protein
MKTKVAVLLSGALVALLLLSRFFALSQAGMPPGWMLYLGLPISAAGVLFALRLINLGAVPQRPPHAPPQPTDPVSERLMGLQAMHGRGAISDTEYSARRLHIISEM